MLVFSVFLQCISFVLLAHVVKWLFQRKFKRAVWATSAVVGYFLLVISFLSVDIHLIANGKIPFFSRYEDTYKDGGSVLYSGIGYTVLALHRLTSRDDEENQINLINGAEASVIHGYTIGYEAKIFFIPVASESYFIPLDHR